MSDKVPYTVTARLLELLALSPVDRGGIWWIEEDLWEEANPGYDTIRNPERDGHYGLAAQTLDPDTLGTVDMLHGHSKCRPHEQWYHLTIDGLSKSSPKRKTLFDVLHRFPLFWRLFFTDRIRNYLYRPRLTEEERDQLAQIEATIRKKFERDAQSALAEYQQNPAWRNCFPGQY
jgi:hypothetical protein